jgi:predicted RNA-binding Zn-ribbon protein involved in translation (DUF1610 family)
LMRGLCKSCNKQVGGMFSATAYQCGRCGLLYCKECSPKVGLILKKPACPTCGLEMGKASS